MDTDDLLLFVTAATSGSLAAAARRLGLTPMTATRRLASLEASLGTRLMHRTTRSLSLTPEGEALMPYARDMVENAEMARTRLRAKEAGAAGLLRVSLPVAFARKVAAPLIPAILETNPELRISLEMSDGLPDLVAEGIDLAIRIANLRDSGLIAQRIADNPRCLVASPDYLRRRGRPASPEDLANHDCLPLTGVSHWPFRAGGSERRIRLEPRFTANSIEGTHAACLAGGGIALLAGWNAADDIRAGRLEQLVFPDAEPVPQAIWAVYPTRRLVPPKVRVFIAAIREAITAITPRNAGPAT